MQSTQCNNIEVIDPLPPEKKTKTKKHSLLQTNLRISHIKNARSK